MQASRFIPVRPTLGPEPLEPRRLMSVVVENGVLLVTGTNGPDRIIVQHHAPGGPSYLVTVEALLAGVPPEVSVVPADGVRSILVRAYAGDDEVELSPSRPVPTVGPVSIPSRVEAGLGNDRVFGGTRRDVILGGPGNDQLFGTDGADRIDGGSGNDFISGGAGDDVLFGSAGNDTVWGMAGNDRLHGGPGDDQLGYFDKVGGPELHEPGDDFLDGGFGNDRLVGGAGIDRMFGGQGRDAFFYLDTREEMIDWTSGEPTDYRPPIR